MRISTFRPTLLLKVELKIIPDAKKVIRSKVRRSAATAQAVLESLTLPMIQLKGSNYIRSSLSGEYLLCKGNSSQETAIMMLSRLIILHTIRKALVAILRDK